MSKIDFRVPLLGFDDEPVLEKGKEISMAAVALLIVQAPEEQGTNVGPQEKMQLFELGLKIGQASKAPVELSIEEIVLLKTRAAKVLVAMSYGRFVQLVDPKGTTEEPADSVPAEEPEA